MAGGSGSFFKNCKSEKVGEYVRGRQEGSRRTEGEKYRDRRHGIKDVLCLKSFFLIFTCADFRFMCWRRIWIFVLCCSRNGTTGTLVDLTDWEPDIVIFSFSLKPELFANTVAAIFHDGKCIAENQIKIMNNGWIGKGDGVGGALGSRPQISKSRSWELQFGKSLCCDSSQKRSRSVYLNEMLIMNHMNEFEIQLVEKALCFADSPDLHYHSFTLMKIRCCGDFWSFTFMLQRRHHHFLLSGGISNTRNSSTILQH